MQNPSPRSSTQQDVKNASGTKSPRGRSPSGKMARLLCKDYLKGTCTTPFCEKLHLPQCLFSKTENGCKFGDECSHAHRLAKGLKRKVTKSAVIFLKNTRQMGCFFQDMEPPKSSSILRKSSKILKPIRSFQFTKAALRHADIRDQNTTAWNDLPGDPHQRSPNALKFEDRSQEEKGNSDMPRKQRGRGQDVS